MPVTPTYPGVYVQEIQSGVHTITGVSTSVTAFIGYTPKGPVNEAVHIYSYGEYERNFGGLSRDSELGYAIQQYFLNGGSEAWVVRVADGATSAAIKLCRPGQTPVLDLTASSEGVWGNYLKVDVDYDTINPDSSFNLAVTEYIPQGAQLVQGRQEVFQNLSMDSTSSQYAPNVINAGSQKLIQAARDPEVTNSVLSNLAPGWSLSGNLQNLFTSGRLTDSTNTIAIAVDGQGPYEIQVFSKVPSDLNDLISDLQSAITSPSNPAVLRGVNVSQVGADRKQGSGFILFTSGTTGEQSSVRLLNASNNDLSKLLGLGLANHGREGGGAAELRPAVNGTLGNEITDLSSITSIGPLTIKIGKPTLSHVILSETATSVANLAANLQTALRSAAKNDPTLASNPAFTQVTVQAVGNRLRVISGTDKADDIVEINNEDGKLATQAKLTGQSGAVSGTLGSEIDIAPDGSSITDVGPLNIMINGVSTSVSLDKKKDLPVNSISDLQNKLQSALDTAALNVSVSVVENRLWVVSSTPGTIVTITNGTHTDGSSAILADQAGLSSAVSGTLGNVIANASSITDIGPLNMAINGDTLYNVSLKQTDLPLSSGSEVSDLATKLQDALQDAAKKDLTLATNPAFTNVRVSAIGNRLWVVSDKIVTITDVNGTLASNAGLTTSHGVEENVRRYSLGVGATSQDQVDASSGNDGIPPTAQELIGDQDSKKGIYALEQVDLFNLLCIPMVSTLDATSSALAVISAAQKYCESRRAFYIIDPPSTLNDPNTILDWNNNKIDHSAYSALYFPLVKFPDPLDDMRLNLFPPSGTLAGLYARIDSNRGVWKAPAGTEATLTNVQALAYNLTNAECGTLNKQGINCLRQFPVYGRVSWGARTTLGSDQASSDWKYIPVRRVALYIEESLYRGTQWVVFEPNDEPLWAQIRLNVGAFMHTLFRQGAFQGSSPRDAYFVKCDKETTTQDDINHGVVNILVGFAPLKPAEFVIIQIQQMAGQIQV